MKKDKSNNSAAVGGWLDIAGIMIGEEEVELCKNVKIENVPLVIPYKHTKQGFGFVKICL